MHRAVTLALFIAALLPSACAERGEDRSVVDPWIGEGRTRVLVDGIHQLEGIPDAVWDATEFQYAHSQSTNRLLRNALRHDVRFRQVKDGELTDGLLAAHDILYINVPTAYTMGSSKTDRQLPRLRDGEVAAIRRFLEAGGSAFVVGEHNNQYDNIEVLRPLLGPLGIELAPAYASELGRGRFAMDVGGYIIMGRRFAKHFVTDGVRMISWSGGAPFTPASKGAVAFLSPKGYIDLGNYVTKQPMEHSNHRVDPGEHQGPDIPIAVAVEVGKGRLVAIGDHNMLGTQWLGVGDNYAFGMNALQWLARREGEAPWRETPPLGLRFGFEQERSGWTIGRRSVDGYYGFFFNLSRRPDIFAMGLVDLRDEVDVLGLLDPREEYAADEIAAIDAVLDAGKRVFLLIDAADLGKGSAQLVRRYLPGISLIGAGGSVAGRDLAAGAQGFAARVEGRHLPLGADGVDVRGGRIAALSHAPENLSPGGKHRDARPKSYAKATPYLLDLRVEGAAPLVWAELPDGRRADLIVRARARAGEIVLMVQGKVFSNHTLDCVRDEPVAANQPAHDLQIAFMEWLAAAPALVAPTPAADAGTDAPDAP